MNLKMRRRRMRTRSSQKSQSQRRDHLSSPLCPRTTVREKGAVTV